MYVKQQRGLTEAERRDIERRIGRLQIPLLAAAMRSALVTGGAALIVASAIYTSGGQTAAGLLLGLGLAWAIQKLVIARRLTAVRNFQIEELRGVLAENDVDAEHVEATAAVRLVHPQTDLCGYFFQIDPGRVLLLSGPAFTPEEVGEAFPNSMFEIVTSQRDNVPLGVFCLGQPLAVSRTVEWKEIAGIGFPTEEIFDARLETLEADLRRLAGVSETSA